MDHGAYLLMGTLQPNVAAFLTMVSHSEGTDRAADPYRVCFGYKHTIQDMSDHPAITGEWMGESLAFLGPAYALEISTAAGRYQINRPTWLDCKMNAGITDFTPDSQDTAAQYLIRRKNAMYLVESGHIAAAVNLCASIWASLPGNDYGQPNHRLADLIGVYTASGGTLA